MAALSAYFAARTQSSQKEIFTQIISTHLLFREGVHYLTLSGLVKPVKSGFSRLCCFHQASSNGIVFVANGVWEREVKDIPVRKSVGNIDMCSYRDIVKAGINVGGKK